jgi:ribosomal protein L11 methyltransferase
MQELELRVPPDAVETVLDGLLELAPHGVFERPTGDGLVALLLRAAADELPPHSSVRAAAGPWATTLLEREVSDDWRARRTADYAPLVVADRLLVRPAWAPPPTDGLLDVVVAEQIAFGLGNHPTTRTCLEILCEREPHGGFTDLGCGSGVLAIAAALLGWDPVTAIDRERAAVVATAANARHSGVAIDVCEADVGDASISAHDTVAANVPLAAHEALAGALTVFPATLVASGVVAEDADALVGLYARAGGREARRKIAGGWAVVVFEAHAAGP